MDRSLVETSFEQLGGDVRNGDRGKSETAELGGDPVSARHPNQQKVVERARTIRAGCMLVNCRYSLTR
jgi:hypothetical protein